VAWPGCGPWMFLPAGCPHLPGSSGWPSPGLHERPPASPPARWLASDGRCLPPQEAINEKARPTVHHRMQLCLKAPYTRCTFPLRLLDAWQLTIDAGEQEDVGPGSGLLLAGGGGVVVQGGAEGVQATHLDRDTPLRHGQPDSNKQRGSKGQAATAQTTLPEDHSSP
jgi:hypothetical protein